MKVKTGVKKPKLQQVRKQILQNVIESNKQKKLQKERDQVAAKKKSNMLEKQKQRATTTYDSRQRILLVGEGNFSFSVALTTIFASKGLGSVPETVEIVKKNEEEEEENEVVTVPIDTMEIDDKIEKSVVDLEKEAKMKEETNNLLSGSNLYCTCFDDQDTLNAKYSDAAANIDLLKLRNATILYGVDATRLNLNSELSKVRFDRIIFHFPHTGCGIADKSRNIMDQQNLISGFIQSAGYLLAENGEIHVTIKQGEPYESWRVASLGRAVGLLLKCAFEFFPHLYPGYAHRRTIGFKQDISSEENEEIGKGSKTYVFTNKLPEHVWTKMKKEKLRKEVRAKAGLRDKKRD